MKCIYCGKEIANGNMCEECSNKRNNLGYTTISNASENILDNSSSQRLYCKDCGSPLNTDGSCPNSICQKRKEKEVDGNTHFTMSLISAIFSTFYHGYFIFICISLIIDGIVSGTNSSDETGIYVILLYSFAPLLFALIPQIISCIFSWISISAYNKYKSAPKSIVRKILHYLNLFNIFMSTVGWMALLDIIFRLF